MRPEMGAEEIKINFKRHKVFLFLFCKFFSKILFLFISSQLYLSHIFVLKFLLIWVVNFLLDFIDNVLIDFILVAFTFLVFVVILNHHDSFFLIVPSSFCRLLFDYFIRPFSSYKERFFQGSINHHYVAFYSKETRIILFLKVFKRMIFLNLLFELLFDLIKIFFIFIKFFIFHIFFQLNTFQLLIHLCLLFDNLFWFCSL